MSTAQPAQGAIPEAMGTALPLPDGELLLVPAELNDAIDAALPASSTCTATAGEWRTAFGAALVRALHERGLILVARAHQHTREAVDANIYSLALSMKGAAERRLHAVARLIAPQPEMDPEAADLVTEFASLIAALTGHAPLAGVGRCAHVDERLRRIHEAALGTSAPTPELAQETA